MLFANGEEDGDRSGVQEPEVGGSGHIDAGGTAHDVIEEFTGEAVAGILLAATFFDTEDNLVTLQPECVHLRNGFRRILQITVHHDDAVAFCIGESGKNSRFLPEVPGEADTAYFRMGLRQILNDLPAGVFGTVVDKHDFIINGSAKQNLSHRFFRERQDGGLIIDRNHQR